MLINPIRFRCKLLFNGFASKFSVIARPVRRLVVAIPRLEGECSEKHPKGWAFQRFLVVIVTWFHSTGGLPRQFANWLAMTAFFERTSANNNLSFCNAESYRLQTFGLEEDTAVTPAWRAWITSCLLRIRPPAIRGMGVWAVISRMIVGRIPGSTST